MDPNKYRNSRYLTAADFTQPRTVVTIVGVTEEHVGDDKQLKAVLKFQEFSKGHVCGPQKAEWLCEHLGFNEDLWIGKRITAVKARTRGADGRTVDCIRFEAAPTVAAVAS